VLLRYDKHRDLKVSFVILLKLWHLKGSLKSLLQAKNPPFLAWKEDFSRNTGACSQSQWLVKNNDVIFVQNDVSAIHKPMRS